MDTDTGFVKTVLFSLATRSFTHAIVFGHIIVASGAYVRDVTTVIDEQWRSTGRQKCSELHHQGEILHYYYTFESVHNGNHDCVVLSCELGGLII